MVARLFARLAYGLFVLFCTVLAAYLSFSSFVRRGVTPVPDLVGVSERDATQLLSDRGLLLRAGAEPERFDNGMPAGYVLDQEPPFGGLVKRGSQVAVTISKGPEQIEVPDVRTKALQAAQVTLTASGLGLGRTPAVYCEAGRPGTIVEQVPPPGRFVGGEATVDVFICRNSAANTYVMPDLVYQKYDAVRRNFERAGFRVGSVKPEAYEGIEPGIVLRQFPLPGHPLRREDAISLVVTSEEALGS